MARRLDRPSVYDQLRPYLDAADVVRRLGLEESRRMGSELYCRPLCHESTSGASLQVNLHTGRWNCKACQSNGVRGDLVQLVEYALSGGRAPTHGAEQRGSAGHRSALVWLCQQYGVPFDDARVALDPALDVLHLFAMSAHLYLLDREDMLQWIREKWGFDVATVEAYGIGFMPSPILARIEQEASVPASRDAFRASGLGWYDADGRWCTRFEGRVTFPYLEHGRAVYLIGRATPGTPPLENGPTPKYHKLSVHGPTRPYVSERITNDHLYNEPVLGSVDSVVVAEGVADAVALSSLGVSVVSPVTISFSATDLERFVRKAAARGIRKVDVLFDNEMSGSGNAAALKVARQLAERGLVARILTVPPGPAQQGARDELASILGLELFQEFEAAEPRQRKEIIQSTIVDPSRREWAMRQVELSKIDAAEWAAMEGAAAAGKFDAIRKSGRDVVELEIEAADVDPDESPSDRAFALREALELAASVDDAVARGVYAAAASRRAGKGITKADMAKIIAEERRDIVKSRREDAREVAREELGQSIDLIVPPHEEAHARPQPPPPPHSSGAPPAPPPPGGVVTSDHARYAAARDSVAKAVEARMSIETVGQYVAQVVTVSMGYTPFRTPDELYIVRGSERIPTGLERTSARFESLLFLASGLTSRRSQHRAYVGAAIYFLELAARRVDDVSWSHVGQSGEVYFPTGDEDGRILVIEPGKVSRTRMSECLVPAVAGADFDPFEYRDEPGGIERALEAFRWTSIDAADRLVLIYWVACLPILRRVGTIPIVRIEGGSSSGKTRTVDAVSYLVNGRRSSSVPTAAALVSRMADQMLTVDDNRETGDVSPAFLGTLLQATHLGAREKRRSDSDTGTVVERVCGALLMNGVEPIHDGRAELASRILTLRCDRVYRAEDSPASERALRDLVVACRDSFWSEAVRRCAAALELDESSGERVGAMIEDIFGATKIGRLSAYLRLMYLAWVAGLDPDDRQGALWGIAPEWREALAAIAGESLASLLNEELAVTCLRYVFAWGASQAKEAPSVGEGVRTALGGRYVEAGDGDVYVGPLRAAALARLVREAAGELNAPPQVSQRLRTGQLEHRILDGLQYLEAAGFAVSIEQTVAGRRRYTFRRLGEPAKG